MEVGKHTAFSGIRVGEPLEPEDVGGALGSSPELAEGLVLSFLVEKLPCCSLSPRLPGSMAVHVPCHHSACGRGMTRAGGWGCTPPEVSMQRREQRQQEEV